MAALVKFGYLTPYQGNVLYRELPHPLLLDGIRIEQSLADRLGEFWYEGRSSGERWWVAAISLASISIPQLRAWPPSKTWADNHMRLQSPRLDRWKTSGATLQHLYATVEPTLSPTLAQQLDAGALHATAAMKMVADVATALHAMHESGLVHGRLSLGAILVEPDGFFRLRRDPFFPPHSPYRGETPSLLNPGHSLLLVAAPELAVADSLPSVQSDLYALGCIWYRCATGTWPVEPPVGSAENVWSQLHGKIPIQPPPHLSATAGKCLQHLLAKNPNARFPTAKAFLSALSAESSQPVITAPQSAADAKSVNRDQIAGGYSAADPSPVASTVREASSDYALARSNSDSPADPKTANAVPASVQQIASEIRDKKTRVVQRQRTAPDGSKPSIVSPVAISPESTSAQPLVQREASPLAVPAGATGPTVPSSPASSDDPAMAKTKSVASGDARSKVRRKSTAKPKKKLGGPTKVKGKQNRPFWVMPVLVAGSCFILLGLVFLLRGQTPSVVTITNSPNKPKTGQPTTSRNPQPSEPAASPVPLDPIAERFDIVTDEGKLPWGPPSANPPYGTELLPMGIEAMVIMSSRTWLHQGPVEPLLAWWDSMHADSRADWLQGVKVSEDAIDHVTVVWCLGSNSDAPRWAVRFTLKETKKLSEVIGMDGWTAKPMTAENADGAMSLWLRSAGGLSLGMVCDGLSGAVEAMTDRVTLGPPELLETIVAAKDNPFLMRRQMDSLRQTTDESADMTVLFAPSFLYGDGKAILGPDSERLLKLLRYVVDDKAQAGLLRIQWGAQWYLEWRALGSDPQAASRNASAMKGLIEVAANQLEAALVTQPAEPYWRAIANRYPQMLRTLSKWTRCGAEDGHVLVNAYLPQEALSNLLIGGWMAARRDWNVVAPTTTAAKPSSPGKAIDQWLETPISVRVEQDSLENVLQIVASELRETSGLSAEPLPMSINGPAFQKDGITLNQQVRGFEFSSKPLREVLTVLAQRANPVTTVQSLKEKDQKVVWLLLDDPSTPSKKKLQFTTRAWSATNNAPLPEEFVIPTN
jgi:serine/threonine protein kinase